MVVRVRQRVSNPQGLTLPIEEIEFLTVNSGNAAWTVATDEPDGRYTSGGSQNATYYYPETGLSPWPADKTFYCAEYSDNSSATEIRSSIDPVYFDPYSSTEMRIISMENYGTRSMDVMRFKIRKGSPCVNRFSMHMTTGNAVDYDFTITEVPSDGFLFAHHQCCGATDWKWHSSDTARRIVTVRLTTSTNIQFSMNAATSGGYGRVFSSQIILPTGEIAK